MSVLSTQHLTIGYRKKGTENVIQHDLNLRLESGKLVGLIGPNGSGKTTLLRTIAGLLKPIDGKILIDDKHLLLLSQHEKALNVSFVLTEKVDIANADVFDMVSFGRFPYNNWRGNLSEEDRKKVFQALQMVRMETMIHRLVSELSDGERQRVMIAKALAQDTPIILLDEPTAHLDVPNRVGIMLLLHKLAHTTGKIILLSTHELDLALQAADLIWLMSENEGIECGVPEDLVFSGSFNRVFASNSYFFNEANGNFSLNYPLNGKVSVSGNKTRLYWTLRALARAGYAAVEDAPLKIEVTDSAWILNQKKVFSVAELLDELNSLNNLNSRFPF
jgi:iron complex transport system ATP-binding protein